jgi:methyl-accepting chemotaxis protein
MKVLRFKIYAYRNRLVPMFVLVMIPWLAVAPWAPWWANSIAMPLLFICAALLFVHVLPTPSMIPRAADEGKLSEAEILRLRKNPEQNAQQLLARWALMTRDSKLQLEEVDQHVTEVMSHAESAVVEIGKRFVEVTRKTRKQVELAVGLLSSRGEESGAGGKALDSLTDYIHASDALLKNLGGQLLALGEQLASLAARQEAVREDSKRIDGALDQLAALASEIRVLALDSSRRGGTDNRAFVEMTDRVRALSLTADESSRAIRKTLEDIKAQAGSTDATIRALAVQARDAGRKSNEEVTALTGATLRKTQEVHTALGEIGALGERIQEDINKIIVELQFQDITQQKLQRLKQPMISELASSWLSMFEETRAFNRKLSLTAGDAVEAPPARFRVSLKNSPETQKDRQADAHQDAKQQDAKKQDARPDGLSRRDDGSKVELF